MTLRLGSPVLLLLIGLSASLAQDAPAPELVASTDPLPPDRERAAFRLPPGFEAQLVASEPDIAKPMNLAFDDRGRLWVTSSREYPYPAGEGQPARDKVVVLSDFAPDGRARSVVTFADGLNIPIGVLPLGDGRRALVHSIPNLYLMSDDDGDGRADRREVAYASYGFQDTHGMTNALTMAFDGWVYACHGFANTSTVKGSDGEAITMNSGNVYRLRADGSHLEQVTWGQVNPFGLALDPLGNLYSCDCHSRPIYQLLRGAYYPSFGKPHDGLGYGPEMMQHDHGSTGIAGIAYLATDSVPESMRGNVLIGNVVTSRINRDRLEWHGSTPRAVAEPDFLISDDPWFRPVDLEIGPDGALYVADFYNRIIGHYEVPLTHPGRDRERGRIWRIVYKGPDAPRTPAPRDGDFTRAEPEELAAALAHPNLAVRLRATNMLAARGEEVAAVVDDATRGSGDARAVAHGLWVLSRIGALDDDTLADAASSSEAAVRVHAQRILAESDSLRDGRRSLALSGLKDSDALVRRCAAEALGRHPAPENLRPLLEARHAADPEDTHLTHVVRMALRDQFRDGSAFPPLGSDWSEADLRAIADVANGVPSLQAARFLLVYLRGMRPETPENLARFEEHVARYGDAETDGALVAFARSHRPDDLPLQALQLRSIHRGLQARGAPPGDDARAWAVGLTRALLDSDDGGHNTLGAELAGALRLPEAVEPLRRLAGTMDLPADRRGQALNALTAIDPPAAVGSLAAVLADSSAPPSLREQAANLLGQSGRPEAKDALLAALPTAPTRLQAPIAVALASDRSGAEALLGLLATGKVSPRLLQSRPVEVRLRLAGIPDLDATLADLARDIPPADEAIAALIQRRQSGFASASGGADVSRGARVFEKSCAACHQIGGQGARVGPQLDGIGARGADRLMEDILDPNRNVDQAFRATTLALDDGRVLTGLILSDEGEVIVLADAQGQEVRIPKAGVEDRKVAPLSPMPANLAEQLEEPDFYDLIAFLLSRREPADTD